MASAGSTATLADEFFPVANPDRPQAACVLVLDTSQSMRGARIEALREGLRAYREFLQDDEEAKMIVETAVIGFSDTAEILHPFASIDEMGDIELTAGGWTSLGAALELAIDTIEERKQLYKDEGIDYYRPFLVVITDGAPTDLRSKAKMEAIQQKVQGGAKERKFIPLFFGTGDANFDKLKEIVGDTGTVAGIDGARFSEFFQWLSQSVSSLKDSTPGDTIQFEDPTRPTSQTPNPFAFEV